ncbi:hypothetical protein HanRHA438_Chr06g0250971 [Helianthus annuus]|nr:hypothetical protein HanRHA438_Chr06g0250971 [Helianthus annuus]
MLYLSISLCLLVFNLVWVDVFGCVLLSCSVLVIIVCIGRLGGKVKHGLLLL